MIPRTQINHPNSQVITKWPAGPRDSFLGDGKGQFIWVLAPIFLVPNYARETSSLPRNLNGITQISLFYHVNGVGENAITM